MKTDEQKVTYLQNLFQETYIKDITERHNIEKINELNDLINVHDSFKKIIIVKDITKPQRDENGIVTINLYDFLLNENSLDL